MLLRLVKNAAIFLQNSLSSDKNTLFMLSTTCKKMILFYNAHVASNTLSRQIIFNAAESTHAKLMPQ